MEGHHDMNRTSRILMLAAALLPALMFVFPLWQITLEAPQYPEGIGMDIYLHALKGAKENDIENINGLNHYIGMKKIEADSIAELKFMPFVIGGLMLLGLLAAWRARRWMALGWALAFIAVGIAGLVDFYLWGYDYGHNLDPRAIIKIPGMSYQPPLFGSQQILNFTAYSYPGIGGISAGVAIALAIVAFGWSRTRKAAASDAVDASTIINEESDA
jgi:copper chaperone NosL